MAPAADTAHSPSRSPSPPGAAPTQDSPGHRATALTNIFTSALTHTLRTCSYENFSACFPTPAKHCPDSLRELWRQMVGKMETLAKSEFDSIMTERAVTPSLNALDRLIAEASRRKTLAGPDATPPIPPHTLPPAAITSAHLTPHLTSASSTLQARTARTATTNAELRDRVLAQRAEIESLVRGLESVVADLEGAVGVMDDGADGNEEGGGGALRREIVGMDEELRRGVQVDQMGMVGS